MSGKITGRLRFRYDDGSFIEWSTKEPKSAEEMHKLVDQYVRFGEPAVGANPETAGYGREDESNG